VLRGVPLVKARVDRRQCGFRLLEPVAELDAPQPPRLLGPEGHVEQAHLRRLPCLHTVRELDVYIFVHLRVQEGCLDVNVGDFPPVGGRFV